MLTPIVLPKYCYNFKMLAATTGMASNYENLTLTGTSFSVDRQFNNKDMLEYVTSKQGFVSGTISHPKQAFASYTSRVEVFSFIKQYAHANFSNHKFSMDGVRWMRNSAKRSLPTRQLFT
jgi:hypothetical protein